MFNIGIMIELSEQDYVNMGLGRALVRSMLRKAREISDAASPPLQQAAPTELLLLLPMEEEIGTE